MFARGVRLSLVGALVVLTVLTAFNLTKTAAAADAPKRLNVVVMVADDLGLQLGCYGDKLAKTPNIDRLAAEGLRYTRAYCTTASCSASRSVILSGLYNHATGHYGHAHGYNHLSTYESVQSLPKILADNGYRTCRIGKYHVAPEWVYPFQDIRDEGIQGARNSVKMAENAKTWIAEKPDAPFFLYWCSTDPHRGGGPGGFSNFPDKPGYYPGIEPQRYTPDQMQVPDWLPDQPEVRQELAEYYEAIARLDAGVGVLVDGLKELGVLDNTLILFLSDNGPPFPGAKTNVYEPGLQLPLIVRDPRQKEGGRTSDTFVNWADLTPTILDWCGVPAPKAPPLQPRETTGKPPSGRERPWQFHGKSIVPTFSNPAAEGFDTLFASHTFHEITMYYPMRVVRVGDWKYIFNIANPLPYPFASDLYRSPTWQGVLSRGNEYELYGKRTVKAYLHRPRHELYDLSTDPHEIRNLADDPSQAKRLEDLQSRLKAWQQQTRDPWELKWEYE